MNHSKFTVPFNTDPTNNMNLYFYPIGANAYEDFNYTVVKDGVNVVSTWRVPQNVFLKNNFTILLEHPSLQPLIKRKKDLFIVFQSSKSEEAKKALEDFMNKLNENLDAILKHIQSLYYLNTPNDGTLPTRSGYDLDFCINEAVRLGLKKLQSDINIIDSKSPSSLVSALLLDENESKQLQVNNNLGASAEKVARKKRGKNLKKINY